MSDDEIEVAEADRLEAILESAVDGILSIDEGGTTRKVLLCLPGWFFTFLLLLGSG